jgi:hypothetical protein
VFNSETNLQFLRKNTWYIGNKITFSRFINKNVWWVVELKSSRLNINFAIIFILELKMEKEIHMTCFVKNEKRFRYDIWLKMLSAFPYTIVS